MGAPESGAEPNKLLGYLALLDFARKPDTRVGWYVRIGVTVIALGALYRSLDVTVGPMLAAKPPPPIPSEGIDDYRFMIPERTRREMFAEIAAAEIAERKRAAAANTWNGHLWSREDDRGYYERVTLRALASKYKVSLSQMFLVLDEGIRNKWPGPDGEPLPATTPPFNPRQTW